MGCHDGSRDIEKFNQKSQKILDSNIQIELERTSSCNQKSQSKAKKELDESSSINYKDIITKLDAKSKEQSIDDVYGPKLPEAIDKNGKSGPTKSTSMKSDKSSDVKQQIH